MSSLRREDIHIISRHANWQAPSVKKALEEQVYPDKAAWQVFLKWLILCLGIGFLTTGIVFFFAYNWDDLHKFVKIGLVEGLLVLLVGLIVFTRLSDTFKKVLLTAAAILVGVLMAVFGQVYQTGADAYDLFLGWTLAITAWVFLAHFAPLWLLYLLLINTTITLYFQQMAPLANQQYLPALLFLLNSTLLIAALLFGHYQPSKTFPAWLLVILTLGAVTMATIGMMIIIFDKRSAALALLLPAIAILYPAGLWYGYRYRQLVYLAVIPLSVLIILAGYFLKLSGEEGMLLFTSLFILTGVTVLIKALLHFHKTTVHENNP